MKPHDMGVLLDECAQRGVATRVHLDRPFDVAPDSGTEYSVRGLALLVQELAGWLAAAGAHRGDRVTIIKDNHWDYDLIGCAAVRIGAVPAQVSDQLGPDVLETLLKRLDASVLVTTRAVLARGNRAGVDLAGMARTTLVLDGDAPGAVPVDEVRGGPAPPPVSRADDEPLVINHTSGTTGVPKLVLHSTGTIINKLARFESTPIPRVGIRRDDTYANINAFNHGRTFCWTASVLSRQPRTVLIISDPDPDRADPILRANPPTIVEALPVAFVKFQVLTERLDNPFHRARTYVSTYDAVHPPTVRAYLDASQHRNPLWMQGWGQTETGPLTFRFLARKDLTAARPDTRNLGHPVPVKTRLSVVDPNTLKPRPSGQAGLVLAKTGALCHDYIGETERWQAKRSGRAGRWWNTGDIGTRRRDGSIELLDREVDHLAGRSCLDHEDVLEDRLAEAVECVVLCQPDTDPLPVVVTTSGELDRRRWEHAVRDLPALREPVVLTWEQVPRTSTGKVRRVELLQQLTGTADTSGTGQWT